MISRTITIDPDTTIREVLDMLTADDSQSHETAILLLSSEHAGLVAGVLAQGLAEGVFDRMDVNLIANKLLDKRRGLCQS